MKRAFTILICLLLAMQGYSQEDPKIDKKVFLPFANTKKEVTRNLNQGDRQYNNKLYDAALSYYLKLYNMADDHSPLNYKIGVSCLNGTNPKDALQYLLRTQPDVASDYQFQLGQAYLYNNRYVEAKEAFDLYYRSLPKGQQKRMRETIRQFNDVCDFSEEAYRDSVPVFIINMGPVVNSYFDEYSPVEFVFGDSSRFYFTSRRPKRDVTEMTGHADFRERIFLSSLAMDDNVTVGEASPSEDIQSKRNVSVSGVDSSNERLLYYKGKKRSGDIYAISFKVKKNKIKVDKDSRLKNKFNKPASRETSASFSEAGDFYFISDRRGGRGGKDIWFSKKTGKNSYGRPVNMGRDINSPFDEEGVFVTPDGNTLYFSSNGHPGMGGFDIYRVEKDETGAWGMPVNMGHPINSHNDDMFYRTTSDSTVAFFSSKRQGGFGGLDLYVVKKDLRIPFELRGDVRDEASGFSLNATVTLFNQETKLPEGSAANDSIIREYYLKMEDGGDFFVQVDAPGYRSLIADFECPAVRHEQVTMNFELVKLLYPYTIKGYVYDVRTGKPVQAEVALKDKDAGEVLYRTVSDINSGYYSITIADKADLDMAVSAVDYFERTEPLLLKNAEGTEGEKNITLQRSIVIYTLSGAILEEGTDIPVQGTIYVFKPGEDKPVQTAASDSISGKYELNLTDTGPFMLEITGEGYFFLNDVLHFNVDSTLVLKNFKLQKLETGVKIVIENILFNTGNATLKAESYTELDKLVNLLKENPNIRIEVSGHTDNTGSAAVNKKLSRSRALSVKNYLTSQGISGDRVEFEGYGYDRPVADNKTAEGRAANRRVEIEILE